MPINSTVSLCLGNYLRQEFKMALERYDSAQPEHPLTFLAGASAGYSAHVSEIAVLQDLITFYDPGTGAHAQRLVQFACQTGKLLGLSEAELARLSLAALLHDIGKIAIPVSILYKPEALNEEEWRIMRLHPEIGQRILQAAGGIFASLAPIVVAHHERWDGSGYPNGLAGEEIPLLARILAVVDSYDAMTTRRIYCAPLTIAEARVELQRCAGSQYDPCIVSAFLAMLDAGTEPVATCSVPMWLSAYDLLQQVGKPLSRSFLVTTSPKNRTDDTLRQNRRVNGLERVGGEFSAPSLRFAGYAPVLA